MKLKHKILIPIIALILYTIGYALYWCNDVRRIHTPGMRLMSNTRVMQRVIQKQKVNRFLTEKFSARFGREKKSLEEVLPYPYPEAADFNQKFEELRKLISALNNKEFTMPYIFVNGSHYDQNEINKNFDILIEELNKLRRKDG